MVSSAAFENEESLYGPIYNSWHTVLMIDTFFGNEMYRKAYQINVRGAGSRRPVAGQVSYVCSEGSLHFKAVPRYDYTGAEIMDIEQQITDVLIKVDDGPIIETSIKAFATFVDDPDTVIKVRDLFRTGSVAKIRTVNVYEKHTYTLDLEGLKSASVRVEDGCPEINS